MADAATYATWLENNADKAGTPEFNEVAAAFASSVQAEKVPPTFKERVKAAWDYTTQRMAGKLQSIPTTGAELAASIPGSAAIGVAEIPVGVTQLGADVAGAAYSKVTGKPSILDKLIRNALRDFEAYRESGNPSTTADLARLGGNMAVGGGVAARLPRATTFPGRVLTGAAVGGGEGAVLPVTSDQPWAERGAQTAAGIVGGGVASVLGDAARLGFERWTNRGREAVAGQLLNAAAGERRVPVVQALRANQNPLAQGSAGQVATPAGSAEFSALQEAMTRQAPSEYRALERTQNAARTAALDTFAGTVDDIEAAQRARSAAANPLYDAARGSTVNVDARRTVHLANRILENRLSNDASGVATVVKNVRDTLYEFYPAQDRAKDAWDRMRQAIATQQARTAKVLPELVEARKILNQVKNFDIDEFTGAERIKKLKGSNQLAQDALKDALRSLTLPDYVVSTRPQALINASNSIGRLLDSKSGEGDVARLVRSELMTIKRSLDAQISKVVPEYKAARTVFADLSKPIDEMEIGAYLRDKLVPALDESGASGSQRAQVFAQAVRDAPGTISRATGFKREPRLERMISPQASEAIQRVGADLARMAEYEALAQAGSQRASLNLGEIYSERAPGMIDRGITWLNDLARRTGVAAKDRTLGELAKIMMDPARTADLMERATEAERRNIGRMFQGALATAAAQGAGTTTTTAIEAQK